jgi:hypothetical protein
MEIDTYTSQNKAINVAIVVLTKTVAELYLQIGYKPEFIKELPKLMGLIIKNGTLKEDKIIIIIPLMMTNRS